MELPRDGSAWSYSRGTKQRAARWSEAMALWIAASSLPRRGASLTATLRGLALCHTAPGVAG